MTATVVHMYACVGTEGPRMYNKLKDQYIDAANSPISICIDYVQPYNSTQHSTGVIGIMYDDLDDRNKGKLAYMRPIILLPGPRKVTRVAPYIRRLLQRLHQMSERNERPVRIRER
jgi:hypothetical protein